MRNSVLKMQPGASLYPSERNKEIRTRFQGESGSDFPCEVEHTGFEPVTSTMRIDLEGITNFVFRSPEIFPTLYAHKTKNYHGASFTSLRNKSCI